MPVNADTYANYFWMKGAYTGDITLELVGSSSGTVYASKTISVQSVSSSFTYYETTYTSTQAPDGNNIWQLTFNGTSVAGGALYFDLVQLFPVTYHARYAILRLSLQIFIDPPGTMASAMTWEPFLSNFKHHFSVFREATTCRLCRCRYWRYLLIMNREGASPADRWKWNETIGPVENRPGRQGEFKFCISSGILG